MFILGLHRSGTTLLYRLLGMSDCFNVLTAYHILCYDEVLKNYFAGAVQSAKEKLNGYFAALGSSNRVFNNVPVSADLTEEYNFLFPPFRGWKMSPATVEVFREACRRCNAPVVRSGRSC